ncbi:MAG: TIGR00730 family Rossman fold protein [Planctomycetes bacterium]|nr:TIGR00730 family Rossman fold protein [Planctomycetota bacterium]
MSASDPSGNGPRTICVFCGSNVGDRPEFAAAARELGERLAREGIAVVYGGARVGIMGAVADAALAAGGRVTGVIPEALFPREVLHEGLTALHVVASMHERKRLMYDLSDAFITLPGGLGTLDELFEVLTWSQLGLHQKACGILNVLGYFDPLLAFLDRATEHAFVPAAHRSLLVAAGTSDALLSLLRAYRPPMVEKWINGEAR